MGRGRGTLLLKARSMPAGCYQVGLGLDNVVTVQKRDRVGDEGDKLGEFAVPEPVSHGQEYQLELRMIGQSLTVKLNGKVLGEVSDATFSGGQFTVGLSKTDAPVIIKSLEFLDLDAACRASASLAECGGPAGRRSARPTKRRPHAATKDAPFVNSLGMKFVPVPIVGGPTGGQRVLFSVWETRVADYEVFATETKRAWPKVGIEQGPTHPAVNGSWEDAVAFCVWLTERERAAGRLGENEMYRLPSDHEWSCAVGIGELEDPGSCRAEGPNDHGCVPLGEWSPPGTPATTGARN